MGPIVVTGASRSGKTLVRWLLSSHSNVTVSRRAELGSIRGAFRRPVRRHQPRPVPPRHRRTASGRVWLGPDRDRLRREFRVGTPSYARLFGLVHEQHAERSGKVRWGDQSGRFEECVGAFLAAYPDATVVHLVRDPRDRYEALISRHAARPGDVGRTTASWLRSVATARQATHAHPNAYHLVRYEDLVTDPQSTARSLCAAIGEPYSPRCSGWTDAPVRHVPHHRRLPVDARTHRTAPRSDRPARHCVPAVRGG